MPKFMTTGEAETKRQKAIEFLRRIGKDDDAERFESMDAAEYAAHKGAELLENPSRRRCIMPRTKTAAELRDEIAELQDRIDDLEEENEQLASDLDAISDIVSGEEEEEEEHGENGGD